MLVFLDASAIIYLLEGDAPTRHATQQVLRQLEAGSDEPPVLATYLTLLVLWDVVYRIGTSWWAAVAAVWRATTYSFDDATARGFARADGLNLAFAAVQLVFVPFVLDRTVLLLVLVGHVLAVAAATALSVGLTLARRENEPST